MGFFSKFFTGGEPQIVYARNAEPTIEVLQSRVQKLTKANEQYQERLKKRAQDLTKSDESYRERLEKRIEELTKANDDYRDRLEKRIQQNLALRETLTSQKKEISNSTEKSKITEETKGAKSFLALPFSQKAEVEALTAKINVLTAANEKYRERLAARIEHNNLMQDAIKSQKSELNAARTVNRRELTHERIDTFFTGIELKLPHEAYEAFIKKCRDQAAEDKVNRFIDEMEKTKYRPFFEQLFAVEMDMAQGFDFKGLGSIVSFQRGEADIALADKQGISMDVMKANQIRITKERFDKIIKKGFIDPSRVDGVCEIGSAWGAATRYMINRFNPETFHSYEIDTGWAQWLKDNLGVDSKHCDGETLSETEDNSMDICVASSCLYFMPFVKQWNYLVEFNRVLKPGGIAVFNVNVIEDTSIGTLKGLLSNYFPRRSFGYLPMHCVETAFPEDQFEKLVDDHTKTMGYHIYRKR